MDSEPGDSDASQTDSPSFTVRNVPTTSNPPVEVNETNSRVNNNNSENAERPEEEKKQLTLEEENRQLKEARMCKVCMDNEVIITRVVVL